MTLKIRGVISPENEVLINAKDLMLFLLSPENKDLTPVRLSAIIENYIKKILEQESR